MEDQSLRALKHVVAAKNSGADVAKFQLFKTKKPSE